MDRVLEPAAPPPRTASKKDEVRLLFPGETSWERWGLQPRGASVLKSAGALAELSARLEARSCLAIPLHQTVIVPIWLSTTDSSLMRDMVLLQLERRGFTGDRAEIPFEYQVIRQEGDRTLLAVYLLPETFPDELCFSQIHDYRPASDFWFLPLNQLLVWKELDSLILAFTSGEGLVYSQSSQSRSLHPSFIHEAHCAILLLESEKVLPALRGITVFGDFSKQEMDALGSALNLPLQHLDRPQPVLPKNPRRLVPAPVRLAQQQKKQKQRNRKFQAAAIGIYLALVCGILGQLAWLGRQKDILNQKLAAQRPQVEDIQATFRRWQALEPAIFPETYPVEMLYRCTRLLPEEGVRLITYEQDSTRINFTGEAKNAPAAFQFAEALKKSPEVDAYVWEMPSPDLLPNDSARFVIEGRRRDAPAQAK